MGCSGARHGRRVLFHFERTMKADKSWGVVVAEDDANDFELLRVAWQKAEIAHALIRVEDGAALLQYLRNSTARVAFVLLDEKMPRKTGHEALEELKSDEKLHVIPVVMFSTSLNQAEVSRAYQLGAASYFVKPHSLDKMAAIVRQLRDYWLEAAELPDPALLGRDYRPTRDREPDPGAL